MAESEEEVKSLLMKVKEEREKADFKLNFQKTKIKLPTSIVIKKAREFQKNIYFCFIDHPKAFNCVDHNKLENS